MRTVVVIPTLKRPEMLALCLEKLRAAKDCPDDIRIFIDYTTDKQIEDDVDYVRDMYFPEASIFSAREHISAPSGCWNILNSLKSGYETGAERICLVEEDVMVFPDYFKWCYAAHANPDCFVTSGRYCPQYGPNYYTNPGASFKSDFLKLVIPYINDEFFADRRGYMDARFGKMDEASPLDDGLIRRVIRKYNKKVVFPDMPKVAHQGFHYYNKLVPFEVRAESIAERIAACRDLLARVSPADRYSQDFEPFPYCQ